MGTGFLLGMTKMLRWRLYQVSSKTGTERDLCDLTHATCGRWHVPRLQARPAAWRPREELTLQLKMSEGILLTRPPPGRAVFRLSRRLTDGVDATHIPEGDLLYSDPSM